MNYEEYKAWYSRPDVKFEIVRFLKNRETVFLSKHETKQNTRMIKIHSVQHLDYMFKALNVFYKHKWYNIYYSLATYINGIPNQQFNDMQRRKINNNLWKDEHWKQITAFDYLIDFDAETLEEIDYAKESCIAVHDHLNNNKTPHQIRFSGRGFHIVIPSSALPELNKDPWSDEQTQYKHYSEFLESLKERFSDMIDNGISDSRRVIKTPYSLAVYPNTKTTICLPILSTKELKDFTINKAYIEEWPSIRGRGTHTFNGSNNTRR